MKKNKQFELAGNLISRYVLDNSSELTVFGEEITWIYKSEYKLQSWSKLLEKAELLSDNLRKTVNRFSEQISEQFSEHAT